MWLRQRFEQSPIAARVLPFVIFLVLTFMQGWFGEASRYWIYALKTLVGAWLVWEMRPFVSELRLAWSWEAFVVGAAVCVMWIGIDGFYPKLSELIGGTTVHGETDAPKPWNPHAQFGEGSLLAWAAIAVRLAGSSLVVPPLEEVFFRSFLYRYLIRLDFLAVPLNRFHGVAFVLTALIFALEHEQWLAGLLCGFAYQALVLRKNRIGDAIVAHGVTNFLLGLWVLWKGDWRFW
jgi:CAAX prenyl protease-like protein